MNFLPTGKDNDTFAKAKGGDSWLTGPPRRVAIIEAGATALAKWWAAGAGAAIAAIWVTIGVWWGGQVLDLKVAVVGGAALVTAVLVGATAYVIASDVKGRAQGQAAIIHARTQVAIAVIQAARAAHKPPASDVKHQIVPLPALKATNHHAGTANEDGWMVIAMDYHNGDCPDYLVGKGTWRRPFPEIKLRSGRSRHEPGSAVQRTRRRHPGAAVRAAARAIPAITAIGTLAA